MILLDTNVLSELMRPRPSLPVIAWLKKQRYTTIFTTSITQAEILLGIELLPAGKRRDELAGDASALFEEEFTGRIFPFGSEEAVAYSRIRAHRRHAGRPISEADAQIAAIAQTKKATLATRNTADFEDCGIGLIDPWKPR